MTDRAKASYSRVRARAWAVLLVALLGGCGGGGTEPSPPPETTAPTSAFPSAEEGSLTAEPIHPAGRTLDEKEGVTVSNLRLRGDVTVQVTFENDSDDDMARPVTKVATIALLDGGGVELDRVQVPSYFEGEVRPGLGPGDRTSKPATFPNATDAPEEAAVVIVDVVTEER